MNIKKKLIEKIEKDTGVEVPLDAKFCRKTLSWQRKAEGCPIWFWYTKEGRIIGSQENMKELLKSEKIYAIKINCGDIILFPC